MISSIRYKSWHQPLAFPYSGIFIANDNLILHYAAHMDRRLCFSKSAESSATDGKYGVELLGMLLWLHHLTHQDPHLMWNESHFLWWAYLKQFFHSIFLLSKPQLESCDYFGYWIPRKIQKKLRRIQIRLGSLRYGEDWKNWVYLESETWEYNDSIQTHKR